MAITIQVEPQQLEPTYNPIIIVATSSRQSEDGFLMIGDIWVKGEWVTRMKVPTNPDGFCVFDIHKHIENRIGFDFDPESSGFNIATESGGTYSVLLGEEWRPEWGFFDNFFFTGSKLGFIGYVNEDPQPEFKVGDVILIEQTAPFTFSQYNGQATIVSISATSGLPAPYNGNRWLIETDKDFLGSTPVNSGTISLFGFRTYIGENVNNVGWTGSVAGAKWAFNGVNTFLEEIDWNSQFWTTNSVTSSFLTNVPDDYEVGTFSRMWLNFFQPVNDVAELEIRVEGMTYSIQNTFTNPLTSNNQPILSVGVGPYQFLTVTSSIIPATGSTFPVIKSGTKRYEVGLVDGTTGLDLVKPKSFKIKDYCSRYEKIQLVFLDKKGSFIPFTFNYVSRENKNITRINWGQHYGSYAPSSQNWTYRSWDRGTKSLDTVVRDNWILTSDWVNQKTSDFLMTLMESPEVYWINEVGVVVAVSLTVMSVERKQIINDQIVNYTVSMDISNKNNMQRG